MKLVGLISGTSADGIDAAVCEINGTPPSLSASIVYALSEPYPLALQQRVLDAGNRERSSVDALCQLNFELGERFAAVALRVIEEAGLKPGDVDLIGSHGQNVWHQIGDEGRAVATLQITEASVIAERTGITTVSNFRPRDVAAGGQGAPLTSYIDWLLLRHPTRWRAVQNIGGIGNVTFLPPLSDTTHEPVAFDTGPGNALMDAAVALLSNGAASYDEDGALARGGQIDEEWLDILLRHPYYTRRPPKTTGKELFSAALTADLVAEARQRGLDTGSVLATFTALTAQTIVDAYQRFAPAPIEEVILGGGGQRNSALVEVLSALLAPVPLLTHEDIGLDSKNKEALVFAILAYETWHGRPGNHPAMTGAAHPVILGQITPGTNYAALIRKTWCG